MHKRFLWLVFIFVSILLFSSESSGSWQNLGGDLQHSGYSESPPVPLELGWKYKVGYSDISAPIIDSGVLFVGSDDNNLYAIDARSGKLKWTYQTQGKVYTPTAKNGMVIAASFDNYIYALDSNGKLEWTYNTGSSVASPPVVYSGLLYGGFDRYIYAIYIINGSLNWRYTTAGWIESTPAIAQGNLYAGSDDNFLYALDAIDGEVRWSKKTGGSISSSPAVINGIVYVGSKDTNVYAIDASTGESKWSKRTNDWVKSSPAVFGNSVYIGSNDNTLYALNTDNGDILWKFNTNDWVDSPPVVINGIVYAGSEDGTVYALDMEKGTLMDKYIIGSGIISLALSDNMLFVTSKDGYVYAFGAPISGKGTATPILPSDKTPPELKINPVPLNVTSENLTISGNAEDPSGILVVTVNGVYAGATSWNATLTLSRGTNIITIVAVDKAGNIRTEHRTVTYIASAQETPPAKIPGFHAFLGFLGIILAILVIKVLSYTFL